MVLPLPSVVYSEPKSYRRPALVIISKESPTAKKRLVFVPACSFGHESVVSGLFRRPPWAHVTQLIVQFWIGGKGRAAATAAAAAAAQLPPTAIAGSAQPSPAPAPRRLPADASAVTAHNHAFWWSCSSSTVSADLSGWRRSQHVACPASALCRLHLAPTTRSIRGIVGHRWPTLGLGETSRLSGCFVLECWDDGPLGSHASVRDESNVIAGIQCTTSIAASSPSRDAATATTSADPAAIRTGWTHYPK